SDFLRNEHARYFVMQKFRVAIAGKRQETDEHRHIEVRRIVEESIEHFWIIHRLGHDQRCALFHFFLEPAQFSVVVYGCGFCAACAKELRGLSEAFSSGVKATVQAFDQMEHADGIEVEYGSCI